MPTKTQFETTILSNPVTVPDLYFYCDYDLLQTVSGRGTVSLIVLPLKAKNAATSLAAESKLKDNTPMESISFVALRNQSPRWSQTKENNFRAFGVGVRNFHQIMFLFMSLIRLK